jgi:hypothetical protein
MLIKASSVTAKAVRWLWLNHLARGGLELLTGLPGLGKSQIQIWYVACATTGKDWPDGSPGCEPCDVIMLTAEDTLDDTMVPRLIAAGANLDRVHFLPYIKRNGRDETFLLAEDLDKLEAHLRTHPEVGLVTLDPITAYLGSGKGLDSHRASDVRSQLSPLKAAAERTLVAFSAVTHPPKSAGPNAHDHFIGSQAFIAAARKGHLCAPETEADGEDVPRPTGRYFFTDAKRNLTKRTPTLVYRIEDVDTERHDPETGECIHAPVIRWEGVEDIMVEEAIAASKPRSGRENVGLKVQKFLTELLAGGPLPYATVMERGAANGYSVDQLKRLKRAMGAVAFKDKAVWMWALAEHAPGSEEDAPEEGRL